MQNPAHVAPIEVEVPMSLFWIRSCMVGLDHSSGAAKFEQDIFWSEEV